MDRPRDLTVPLVKGDILVVDPRRLSREALRGLLESWSLSVIGDGRTLEEALQGAPADARPDLVLHLFESDEETRQGMPHILAARARFPGVKSVLLTDGASTDVLLDATRASVEAILSRDISTDVLRRAIELVLLGQRLLPTGLARMLLEPAAAPWAARKAAPPPPAPPPSFPGATQRLRATTLSPREHEILRHLVDGLPNKAIARALDITEATVKVHIKGLLRKMNMTNRTQAAVWALSHRMHDDAVAAAGAAEAAVDRIAAAPRHAFPVPADDPVVAAGHAAAPARAAAPAMNGAADG